MGCTDTKGHTTAGLDSRSQTLFPSYLPSHFQHLIIRKDYSFGCTGSYRGIDSPVAIRKGEGAQIKWCRDPRCSPRGNPACRGTFAVASRVSSTVSHLRTEYGTSLETPGTSVFPWSETGMLGNFGVASRVPSSISNFKMERGTSLETLAGKGLILQ